MHRIFVFLDRKKLRRMNLTMRIDLKAQHEDEVIAGLTQLLC